MTIPVGHRDMGTRTKGVFSATNTEPAPTGEDTACVELIGAAERAATAEPEALEAWVDDEAGRGYTSRHETTVAGASTRSRHCCRKVTRASERIGATWHYETT